MCGCGKTYTRPRITPTETKNPVGVSLPPQIPVPEQVRTRRPGYRIRPVTKKKG